MNKIPFQNMFFFFFSCIILLSSCKKNTPNDRPNSPSDPSKIAVGLISGFVVNQSGSVIESAVVTIGGLTSTTDKYGYFEVGNAQVAENAGTISIAKAGYFSNTKTFVPSKGNDVFLRVMLLAKKNIGTISAASGGHLSSVPGSFTGISIDITLPANAVVVASSGVPYNGIVSVAAQFPSRYDPEFYRMIPGDLRCIDSIANEKMISFISVVFIEFSGSSGELLQIAKDKSVSLNLNIPNTFADLLPPANTSMWYFDDSTGFWKKGGEAIKTGNSYKGEINKTGCWNYNEIEFDKLLKFECTVLDKEGYPVPNILVGIEQGGHISSNFLHTNSSGYVKGIIPANTNTSTYFRIFWGGSPQYSQISYEKMINSLTSDLSLGTITLGADYIINLQGIVADCETGFQNDGYIMAGYSLDLKSGDNYRFNLIQKDIGGFRINVDYAGGVNFPFYLVAVNNKNLQTSLPSMTYLNPGKYTLPTFEVCNLPTLEYMNYTVDSVEYAYRSFNVGDNFTQDIYFLNPPSGLSRDVIHIFGGGANTGLNLTFDKADIRVGKTNYIYSMFFSPSYNSSYIEPISQVTITEYGNIGEYISGSFIATAREDPPSSIKHLINGNFRVKRVQ